METTMTTGTVTKTHAAEIALAALRDLLTLGGGMYVKNALETVADLEVYLALK